MTLSRFHSETYATSNVLIEETISHDTCDENALLNQEPTTLMQTATPACDALPAITNETNHSILSIRTSSIDAEVNRQRDSTGDQSLPVNSEQIPSNAFISTESTSMDDQRNDQPTTDDTREGICLNGVSVPAILQTTMLLTTLSTIGNDQIPSDEKPHTDHQSNQQDSSITEMV
jgi:hypothetical protein